MDHPRIPETPGPLNGPQDPIPQHPPRFLVRPDALDADTILVEGAEARHVQVRRLQPGASVIVFDGRGKSRLARIRRISRKSVELTTETRLPFRSGESPLRLTLALALLKGEKFETVIERGTELGVSRFLPFASARSLGRPSPQRRERWHRIALSAAKQCGRTVVPRVEEPVPFETVLEEDIPCRILFREPGERDSGLDPGDLRPDTDTLLLAVGPEGGFASSEVESALAAGWAPASLGSRTLRSETAALTAVVLCQYLWGDLHPRNDPGK